MYKYYELESHIGINGHDIFDRAILFADTLDNMLLAELKLVLSLYYDGVKNIYGISDIAWVLCESIIKKFDETHYVYELEGKCLDIRKPFDTLGIPMGKKELKEVIKLETEIKSLHGITSICNNLNDKQNEIDIFYINKENNFCSSLYYDLEYQDIETSTLDKLIATEVFYALPHMQIKSFECDPFQYVENMSNAAKKLGTKYFDSCKKIQNIRDYISKLENYNNSIVESASQLNIEVPMYKIEEINRNNSLISNEKCELDLLEEEYSQRDYLNHNMTPNAKSGKYYQDKDRLYRDLCGDDETDGGYDDEDYWDYEY